MGWIVRRLLSVAEMPRAGGKRPAFSLARVGAASLANCSTLCSQTRTVIFTAATTTSKLVLSIHSHAGLLGTCKLLVVQRFLLYLSVPAVLWPSVVNFA